MRNMLVDGPGKVVFSSNISPVPGVREGRGQHRVCRSGRHYLLAPQIPGLLHSAPPPVAPCLLPPDVGEKLLDEVPEQLRHVVGWRRDDHLQDTMLRLKDNFSVFPTLSCSSTCWGASAGGKVTCDQVSRGVAQEQNPLSMPKLPGCPLTSL